MSREIQAPGAKEMRGDQISNAGCEIKGGNTVNGEVRGNPIPMVIDLDDDPGSQANDSDPTLSGQSDNEVEVKRNKLQELKRKYIEIKTRNEASKEALKICRKDKCLGEAVEQNHVPATDLSVKPGAIEVCCGSAALTFALSKENFHAVGVDWEKNKDKPKGKCVQLDLTSKQGQEGLNELIKANNAEYVHMSPPCGTASLAREIRMKNRDGTPANFDPKPLRSQEFPDGLPMLSPEDKERVDKANEIYRFCAELAWKLTCKGIRWTIENPTGSLMWQTSWFCALAEKLGSNLSKTEGQMCMFGGARNKKTLLWHSKLLTLKSLQVMCDKSHQHMPWGILKGSKRAFATAKERNYPDLWCLKLAREVAAQVPRKVQKAKPDQSSRVLREVQPRRGMQEIIPEFKEIQVLEKCGMEEVSLGLDWLKLKSKGKSLRGLELGSEAKVLHVEEVEDGPGSGCKTWQITVGIHWTPSQFVDEAMTLVHPFDRTIRVPPSVAEAVSWAARVGPHEVVAYREREMERIKRLAKTLEPKEIQVHSKLNPDVEAVVKSKNILLFERLLREIRYDDMEVVSLLIEGVALVGELPKTGIWKPEANPPSCNAATLWANARDVQKKLQAPKRPTPDDTEVWAATMVEVEEGSLRGPFSPNEMEARQGPRWLAARRFAVRQGAKIRPIDDFSEFSINQAFGTQEKVEMVGLDQVVGWARARWDAVDNKGRFVMKDTAGCIWEETLHKDWSVTSWRELQGRVADLKQAYKQLPRHPKHAAFSNVAVRDPSDNTTKFFEAVALMFGESAAVYGFLRFSRALSALATKIFGLIVTEFFDDFTQVEPKQTAPSAMVAMEFLVDILGWKLSVTPEKRKKFDDKFVSLGVQVDFRRLCDGDVVLRNKEGRTEALAEIISEILATDEMGFKEALSIRGKLTFAEGQLFGRVSAPATRMLSWWSFGPGPLNPNFRSRAFQKRPGTCLIHLCRWSHRFCI